MTIPELAPDEASRSTRILENAARLFSQQGFGEASMRDLAAINDISIAGLYHYFPSKAAILAAIVDTAVNHLVEALRDAVASTDAPEDRVRAIVKALVATAIEHREAVHTLFENTDKLTPEHQAEVRAKQHEATVLLQSELNTLKRRGMLADLDVPVAAFALIGMTNWTHFWFREDGPRTADQVGEEMAEIFLHGVLR